MDTPNTTNNRLLGDAFSTAGFEAQLQASNARSFSRDNLSQIDYTVGSPSSKENSLMTTATAAVILGLTLLYASRHPGSRRLLEKAGLGFDRMEPAFAGAESGLGEAGRGESRGTSLWDRLFGSKPAQIEEGAARGDNVMMMAAQGNGGGAAFDVAAAKESAAKARLLEKDDFYGALGGKKSYGLGEIAEKQRISATAELLEKDAVADDIRQSLKPLTQAERDAVQEVDQANRKLTGLKGEKQKAVRAGTAAGRDFDGEERTLQTELAQARQRQEDALKAIHEKMQAVERRGQELYASPDLLEQKTVSAPDPRLRTARKDFRAAGLALKTATEPGLLHEQYGSIASQLGRLERVETAGGRLPKTVVSLRGQLEDVARKLGTSDPFDIKDAAAKLQAYVDSAREFAGVDPSIASSTAATTIREVHSIAPSFNIIRRGELQGITARALKAGTDEANWNALDQIHTFAGDVVKRYQ